MIFARVYIPRADGPFWYLQNQITGYTQYAVYNERHISAYDGPSVLWTCESTYFALSKYLLNMLHDDRTHRNHHYQMYSPFSGGKTRMPSLSWTCWGLWLAQNIPDALMDSSLVADCFSLLSSWCDRCLHSASDVGPDLLCCIFRGPPAVTDSCVFWQLIDRTYAISMAFNQFSRIIPKIKESGWNKALVPRNMRMCMFSITFVQTRFYPGYTIRAENLLARYWHDPKMRCCSAYSRYS